MMTKLNLLPWRKEIRDRNNIIFGVMVAAALSVCIVFLLLGYLYTQHLADIEQANIDYLKNEVRSFDAKIGQIKNLQDEKNKLLTHVQVIQSLQMNRGVVVKILDAVSHSIPQGVYLTELTRKDNALTVLGITDTNSNVSDFIEALKAQKVFASVDLNSIKTEGNGEDNTSKVKNKKTFQLSLSIATPGKEG